MSALFEKLNPKGIKNIIAVASGKGGVGKSTVTANLAVTLVREGYKVAIVDADVYGPSIPHMFGLENSRCEVSANGDKQMFFPPEKYGVKIMSVGFLMPQGQPLVWRGPLASKLILQLFDETVFGDLDYLIIDFPPGTGDVQLTILQHFTLAGGIMVTTPQQIALDDARRAASMFTKPELNVPLLGVVENLSWFTPVAHPEEKYYVFGKGGGQILANEFNTTLLGQIPLVMEVGEAAEHGKTVFSQDNKAVITAFENIGSEVIKITSVTS
jgi:ATP-binding protein involved in chromosome partitioning